MGEKRNGFRLLIKRWIEWDCDLWVELNLNEIEILKQRFVYELSFAEIAQVNKTSVILIRISFENIMEKLTWAYNQPFVELLREHDDTLESRSPCSGLPLDFDHYHIWLN